MKYPRGYGIGVIQEGEEARVMTNSTAKRTPAPARTAGARATNDGLPSMVARLGDDLTNLVDLRLNLLKVELRDEVNDYVRRGIMLTIGGVIVAVGFALANIALAFFMSTLFANTQLSQPVRYGLGFSISGLIYLVTGGLIVVVSRRRLASQDVLPRRSLAEFENDKQLVKTVMQG